MISPFNNVFISNQSRISDNPNLKCDRVYRDLRLDLDYKYQRCANCLMILNPISFVRKLAKLRRDRVRNFEINKPVKT